MPKLERLEWVLPLSEGKGVTLTDMPEANMFLAEDPNALLLGVMCDSQYQTRRAFAIPYVLRQRLGHFEIARIAGEIDVVHTAFTTKPALHRFPNRCAALTSKLAQALVDAYGGDGRRMWTEAASADELAGRLMALPAFGAGKTDWTVGMLGRLGVLSFGGWEEYRVPIKSRPRAGDLSPTV
ncbi:MAG TPA: Fe-S cluster assembly protein HesB [Chloroflexota bacterium]|jgi:uncharacterized HhH-GPD family protein|nr:Fe-S cluster assembly protein HesB [Chloroflexota bacterium]